MSAPSLTGIIVTYNRAEDLLRTLEHVRRDGVGISEWIVVDNASSDGTAELVAERFPEVKLLRLHENTGVCFARNVGAANAKGDLLLFLDDDCFVDFSAILKVAERMASNPQLAVVGFNLIDLPLDDALRVYEAKAYDRYQQDEWSDAAQFPGGACLVRRAAFTEVDGYDDQLFYLGEESELGIRLFDRGYKIQTAGDVVYLHYASPSSRPSTRRVFYYYRNRIITVGKHYPFPFCLFETLGLVVLGFIRSIREGRLIAFVKGVVWGIGRVLTMQVGRRPMEFRRFFRYYRFAHGSSIVARFMRAIMGT